MLTKNPYFRKLIYLLPTALLVLATLLIILSIWPYKQSLFTSTKSWQQLNDIILPHITTEVPVGKGPFPVVVVIPGCEGIYPERAQPRMEWLAEQEYLAVMVDSHSGRGLDKADVCSGQALWGQERAGDIYVALDYVRQLTKADTNNIALLGYSHGGWSILDALSYDGKTPNALASAPFNILRSVKGAVVYYPYCDFPARARSHFNSKIPLLALNAGADTTVNPKSCNILMKSWQDKKLPVTTITYPDAGHGFDVTSHQNFAPAIDKEARAEVSAFLRKVFSDSTPQKLL